MAKRFHAIVTGKVQGVFFRVSVREKAMGVGLQGFVRNLPDGSVELEAQGEKDQLDLLFEWCKHGPPGARVDQVEQRWISPVDEETDFNVLM